MSNAANLKRLSVAHANLLSAHRYLQAQFPSSVPPEPVALVDVDALLSEASLATCMNDLVSLGQVESPKPAFWRDLERAAESLNMEQEASAFHRAFLKALRNGEPSK